MSERVTNMEVEDVLSSIRRLVKKDGPDEADPDRGGPNPHSDRFVLTPALRVDNRSRHEDTEPFVLRDAIVPGDPVAEADKTLAPDAPADDTETSNITGQPDPVDDHTEPSAAYVLSAKIAALETAIGNISGQWEPDTPGEDDYSGTKAPAIIWQDDVDLDAKGKPIRPSAEPARDTLDTLPFVPAGQDRAFNDGTVDDILDEDALRSLVSDIVRAELQGELGARITRNVRKLVRREIHRALAARDLG